MGRDIETILGQNYRASQIFTRCRKMVIKTPDQKNRFVYAFIQFSDRFVCLQQSTEMWNLGSCMNFRNQLHFNVSCVK